MSDIRRQFLQEMRSLQEEAVQFARDYPEAAKYLDPNRVDDRDPYVERLTEGFAFLTARIRETIAAEPGGTDQLLLDLVAPHRCDPLPSTSVVEFRLGEGVGTSIKVPVGTTISSVRSRKQKYPFRFTLVEDVDVHPFHVVRAKAHSSDADSFLDLVLQHDSRGASGYWPDKIPLFLSGDASTVWALRFALTRKVSSVQILSKDEPLDAPTIHVKHLSSSSLATHVVLPDPLFDFRDFCCADECFRFVEITGISACCVPLFRSLRLRFRFVDQLAPWLARSVRPTTFRTNVGMVVNSFEDSLEPLSVDHTRTRWPLRPLGGEQRRILDVRTVQSRAIGGAPRSMVYVPFASFQQGGVACHGFFQTVRSPSVGGFCRELVIGSNDANWPYAEESLSLVGLCCDGNNPRTDLNPSDLCILAPSLSASVAVRAIQRPGPVHEVNPAVSSETLFLTFARPIYGSMLDLDGLAPVLHLLNWDPSEAKRSLIEGLREIQHESEYVYMSGCYWRLFSVKIRLNDQSCTPQTHERLGLIDAFGGILYKLVMEQAPIGSRSRLDLEVQPCGVVLSYADIPLDTPVVRQRTT